MQEAENSCQIYIQISSADRPGILAEALESVVSFHWNVLDIKQFVFNGLLNLSLLLGSDESNSSEKKLPTLKPRLGCQAYQHLKFEYKFGTSFQLPA
jgi:predicted amino acid-binding ACT domain protein